MPSPEGKRVVKGLLVSVLVVYVLFLIAYFAGLIPATDDTLIFASVAIGLIEVVLVLLLLRYRKDPSSDDALAELKTRLDKLKKSGQ